MDPFVQVAVFGCAAFACFVYSVLFAVRKRYAAGLGLGVLELLAALVSSAGWAYLLRISGKTDWRVLGFYGYRPVAVVFFAMLLAGVVCIGANLGGAIAGSMVRKPAALN